MKNDNKTVEKVALSDRPLAEQIRIIRGNYCIGSGEFDALDEAADVVECHRREIAAKDAEIERLKAALKPVLECPDRWHGHWPFAAYASDAVKEAQSIYIREMQEGVFEDEWIKHTILEFADRIKDAFAMHAKAAEQHETNYTTPKGGNS